MSSEYDSQPPVLPNPPGKNLDQIVALANEAYETAKQASTSSAQAAESAEQTAAKVTRLEDQIKGLVAAFDELSSDLNEKSNSFRKHLPLIIAFIINLIVIVGLFISMRVAYNKAESARIENSISTDPSQNTIAVLNERTSVMLSNLGVMHQEETANFQIVSTKLQECIDDLRSLNEGNNDAKANENQIAALQQTLNKLEIHVSQLKKFQNGNPSAQEIQKLNDNITAIQQALAKLQAGSSQKSFGVISINSR